MPVVIEKELDRAEGDTRISRVSLFLYFLRLGLTSFGGPAMVAYIRELAVKNKWLTEDSFKHGVALCQAIPGATAMQVVAYVGLRARGWSGALVSFIGFGLPAFLLMVIFSVVYRQTQNIHSVVSIFQGLQLIVVALVANATIQFGASSIKCRWDIFLALAVAIFLGLHGSPILAIALSALVGLVLYKKINLPHLNDAANITSNRKTSFLVIMLLLVIIIAGMVLFFILDRKLFTLALMMMKIDLFAFGGGFASVPLMFHEVVEVRHWIENKTFMDAIALGQITPGPIVITATFVGYQVAGLAGAVVGTIGIFSPSFLMVLITVPYLDRLQHSLYFRRALHGVLVSFVGLLLAVTVHFGFAVHWNILSILIAALALIALQLKVDILWVVIIGAVISVIAL